MTCGLPNNKPYIITTIKNTNTSNTTTLLNDRRTTLDHDNHDLSEEHIIIYTLELWLVIIVNGYSPEIIIT